MKFYSIKMNSRFWIFLLLSIFSTAINAQPNLYFINRSKHKVIEVIPGHQLSVKYNGYLGQPEFFKQTLSDITDSSITLGIDPEMFGASKKLLANNPRFMCRRIMLRDIVAFRRITLGRQLLKSTLMTANIVGTYFLLTDLYRNNRFSNLQTFLISLGVGIGTSYIINIAFPENPKYRLEDGWEIVTGYEKPKL